VQAVGGPEHRGHDEHDVHPVDEDQVGAAERVGHAGEDGRAGGGAEPAQQEEREGLGEDQGEEGLQPDGVPGGQEEVADAEGRHRPAERERARGLADGDRGIPTLEDPVAEGAEEGSRAGEGLRLVRLDRRLDVRHPADRVAVGRLRLDQVDTGVGALAQQGVGHEQERTGQEHRGWYEGPPGGLAGHVARILARVAPQAPVNQTGG
jgi:hypothetical protein